jgi:8-amino-7-oxononanoate synthase
LKIKELDLLGLIQSSSPIQSMIFEGNHRVRKIAELVQKDGFDVRPILSPTVPKGKERIRICIHAFNSENEIEDLVSSLEKNYNFISEKTFA